MRTLLIAISIVFYEIAIVKSSVRDPTPKKRSLLLNERTSFIQNDPSKKKQIRKSDHYIDPRILEHLSGVKDIRDLVRRLNPKGFTIKKEKVLIKVPKAPGARPGIPIIGRPGVPGTGKPDYVYEEVEEETVYYQGQKVAEPLQSSSSSDISCIPRNVTQSLERLGVVSYPPCVIVKKCGGCCRNAKECVAASTVNETITVIEISGTGYQVVSKTLTHDATCQCDCIVKASDCLPTQTYVKDRCQCECIEKTCPTGKHWSKPDCNCICSKPLDCTSLVRKWDESSCSCVCIDTPCPTGQSRNQENCLCS